MTDFRIVQTTGTTEPITLDEVKNYLRLDNTADDTLITAMITNARLQAEKYLNSDILAKDREMFLTSIDEPFNLPYAPLNLQRDGDGVLTNFTVTVDGVVQTEGVGFELLGLDNPRIRLNTNIEAFGRGGNRGDFSPAQRVNITYSTLGLDNAMINQGLLALCAWLYYGRTAKMGTNWKSWLSPFKTWGYYGTR